MDRQDREDVFLLNTLLGTDLATSYVAATDPEPPKRTGCGCGLLAALLAAGFILWRDLTR